MSKIFGRRTRPGTVPTFVVVGARGDVAMRFFLPALAEIRAAAPGRIGPVIALELPYDAVPDGNRAQRRAYRRSLRDALAPEMLDQLGEIAFLPGDATKEDLWERLAVRLAETGAKDVILFLAIPPYLVNPVLKRLQAALPPDLRVRILLDKPWGLMPKLTECSWREQIQPALTLQALFLDHYLGKAPVRALADLLDRHPLLRAFLAGRHLASLEVAIEEAAPVGPRPNYAETGAMVDMGNHLLNLAALALVGLSGADRSDAEIDALRASSLAALCRARPDTVCLGQYNGFPDELGIDAATRTETCFDVGMAVDLTGLAGSMLPDRLIVRLRSGKALEARTAHVVATYSDGACLTVTIQPKPWVQLSAPDGGVVLNQWLDTAGLPQGAPYGVLIRELIDGQNRWLVPYDGVTAVNGWTSALCCIFGVLFSDDPIDRPLADDEKAALLRMRKFWASPDCIADEVSELEIGLLPIERLDARMEEVFGIDAVVAAERYAEDTGVLPDGHHMRPVTGPGAAGNCSGTQHVVTVKINPVQAQSLYIAQDQRKRHRR